MALTQDQRIRLASALYGVMDDLTVVARRLTGIAGYTPIEDEADAYGVVTSAVGELKRARASIGPIADSTTVR